MCGSPYFLKVGCKARAVSLRSKPKYVAVSLAVSSTENVSEEVLLLGFVAQAERLQTTSPKPMRFAIFIHLPLNPRPSQNGTGRDLFRRFFHGLG